MSRPTLDEVQKLAGQRVRVTVPKPREDQRLEGVLRGNGEGVRLEVETASDGHATVVFRERDGDGVLRAFRGPDAGTLIGRVERIETVE